MGRTYTYTARNIENPEQVVTFTLRDHRMSVGLGAPLEQIETVLRRIGAGARAEEEAGQIDQAKLWLKPLVVSLLQRGIGQFRVADVNADAKNDRLRVIAWFRVVGLALAPIILMDGRVDNPRAAQAFVEELDRRKSEIVEAWAVFDLVDYWFAWALAGILLFGLFQAWRRRVKS